MEEPPIIDMSLFLDRRSDVSADILEECRKVALSFHKFGICIVKDPRVNHEENEAYLDMMETYFERVSQDFYAGRELADSRPELSFQTGVTPESVEMARNHEAIASRMSEVDKPMTLYPLNFDAKWRFFWPIGERPSEIKNDLPKIIPQSFSDWEQRMDSWGNHMINAV